MITDTTKITVGPRPYKVRAGHNLRQWEAVASSLHYDKNVGEICSNVYFLERNGVQRDFISYAVRSDFLRVVNA